MEEILFICEGSTEVFLLAKIFEKEFNIELSNELKENGNLTMKKIKGVMVPLAKFNNISISITNLDGETKLQNYTKVLSNERFFNKLTKIIYLMDADYSQGTETGFIRTEKAIKESIEKLKEISENVIYDYFITPNNKDDGMTETLLLEALSCKEIVKYIKNDVIPKIKEMDGSEISNEQKSTFMMVAATQNPLRGTASSFISKCYNKLDKESNSFKNLYNFLKNYIN